MSKDKTDVSWSVRRQVMAQADGAEWERLSEAFDTDWTAAYITEFIRFAKTRGWNETDAESWCNEIARDALLYGSPGNEYCPVKTARQDVVACENEVAITI